MNRISKFALCLLLTCTAAAAAASSTPDTRFESVWETTPLNPTLGAWRPAISSGKVARLIAIPHGAAIEARYLDTGDLVWSQAVGTPVRVAAFHAGLLYVGGIVGSDGTTPSPDFAVFDAQTGEPRWNAACGGVFQPPVFHDGGLVVASTHALIAFDEAGRPAWSHAYPRSAGGFPGGPGPAGAVLVGHHIVTATGDGMLRAYALADGRELWSVAIGGRLQSPMTLAGHNIVCAVGAQLIALDSHDGSTVWTRLLPGDPGLAATLQVGGQIIVLTGSAGRALCVDAASGAFIWSTSLPAPAFAAPVPSGDLVLVGDGTGTLIALVAATGLQQWSQALGTARLMDPVIEAGYLAIAAGDGRFAVFKAGATTPAPALPALAFPNPARDLFTIDGRYDRIRLYDATGRLRRTGSSAGSSTWTTTDQQGRPLAPGAYFLQLTDRGRSATVRLNVIR